MDASQTCLQNENFRNFSNHFKVNNYFMYTAFHWMDPAIDPDKNRAITMKELNNYQATHT